ncbi:hypothetical protein ACO0K9_11795 [Undibacterium sp. Ji50W]|uniref:hypothetical protein n=1 Tax=Undibacterium sp. Ji50W TaxID=3413041 RepID=UPI003BEF53F7
MGSRLAFAADVPRLWEISGTNQTGVSGKFYILPVTHNGLDVEYDHYLQRTIMPLALKADVFSHEAALLISFKMPACPVPLSDTPDNRQRLQALRDRVTRADAAMTMPTDEQADATAARLELNEQQKRELHQANLYFVKSRVENLSEYGLHAAMIEKFSEILRKNPELKRQLGIDRTARSQIASFIALERKEKTNASIENATEMLEAYCNMGDARLQFLEKYVTAYDPFNFKPMSDERIAHSNKEFSDSVSTGFLTPLWEGDSKESDREIICGRNKNWIRTIKQNLGEGVQFYALGLSHVFQSKANPERCDGLLEVFRKEGYSVKLLD